MQRPRCSTKAPNTRRSSASMMKSRLAITRACRTDAPYGSETLQNLIGAALHVGQRAFHRLGARKGCGSFFANDEFDGRLAPDILGQRFTDLRDLHDVCTVGQLLPGGAF